MNVITLLARLEEVSKVRKEDLMLRLQVDGSGAVEAFMDDAEVFEFEDLSQLSAWLDAQLCGVVGDELSALGATQGRTN